MPRRLAAMLYDCLAVVALMFAVAAVAITLNQGEAIEGNASRILGAVLATIWLVYLAVSWRGGGQTLGMRAWRLQLINDRPGRISLRQVLIRWLLGIAGFALAGLGYFWSYFRRDRRAWPDLLSGSRIVKR